MSPAPPTILLTGAAGYVGAVLSRQLLAAGHHLVATDALLFGGNALLDLLGHPRFRFVKADLCDPAAVRPLLDGVDAVVHLAAIVGDPACKAFPEAAAALMADASEALYQGAREAGVRHFVFASTCSNYGLMDGDTLLDEDAPLQPLSHYARLKVGFEHYLIGKGEMPTTILRFATAYGHSPRPRFDLTVNHFTRDLSVGADLEVFAAQLWRPYCHVEDLAAAAVLAVGHPPSGVAIYNVGDTAENYTKASIIDAIRAAGIHTGNAHINAGNAGDLRNYRVDFSRIHAGLGFRVTRRLPDGIAEMHRLVVSGLIDPFSIRYQNV